MLMGAGDYFVLAQVSLTHKLTHSLWVHRKGPSTRLEQDRVT